MIFRSKKRQQRIPVKSSCYFCQKGREPDFKEIEVLARFTSDRGKILNRSYSGLCQKHQKRVTRAVKRARHLALLPFVVKV